MKNVMKDALLIGAGIGATIAYQKYNKPAMKQIEKMIDKTVKKVDDTLDEMM